MLTVALKNASSDQMKHILHGNHVGWCASRFMETGTMEADVFHVKIYGQNPIDFYVKDIGTIMPSILYTLAILGVNPVEAITWLDYGLYAVDKAAAEMQKQMLVRQEVAKTA